MTPEELQRFTRRGLTIMVGTVDADGFPACCRASALQGNQDFTRLTVFLPVATAQQTVANIATTRRLAVVASSPPDHATVQFKGWSLAVRLASPEEAELIRAQASRFAEVVTTLGVPPAVTGKINRLPAYAVEMSLEVIYDQTPGPKAGSALS